MLISLIALPLLPFNKFIEDPVVLNQLKSDLETPPEKALAMTIKNNVPNWSNYTWLSSGAPEINAYLPLNYYIAHNPHFSHQASNYSKRLKIVESLTRAKDSSEFYQITNQEKINALLFYKSENYYNFFYWADDYPNGGKNAQLKIPENLVEEKFWTKIYDNGGWYIYLIK